MNRRTFLQRLAAVPFLGAAVAKAAPGGAESPAMPKIGDPWPGQRVGTVSITFHLDKVAFRRDLESMASARPVTNADANDLIWKHTHVVSAR